MDTERNRDRGRSALRLCAGARFSRARARCGRPPTRSYQGAYAFERLGEHPTRLDACIMLAATAPQPEGVPRWLQEDLRTRSRCSNVAHHATKTRPHSCASRAVDGALSDLDDLALLCSAARQLVRRNASRFPAAMVSRRAPRDAARSASLATALLAAQSEAGGEARQFLLRGGHGRLHRERRAGGRSPSGAATRRSCESATAPRLPPSLPRGRADCAANRRALARLLQ